MTIRIMDIIIIIIVISIIIIAAAAVVVVVTVIVIVIERREMFLIGYTVCMIGKGESVRWTMYSMQ